VKYLATKKEIERNQRKKLGLSNRGPKPSTPTRSELAAIMGAWMIADERRAGAELQRDLILKRVLLVCGFTCLAALWGAL
jgi:hypothetical protein